MYSRGFIATITAMAPASRTGQPRASTGARSSRAHLWLLQASSAGNATSDMINAAPSGMSWLSSMQDGFASAAQGNGLMIALGLAAISAASCSCCSPTP
jgi:hypothetical protein